MALMTRRIIFEHRFNADGHQGSSFYPNITPLSFPNGPALSPSLMVAPRGRLRAVRLRYADFQTKVMTDFRLRIVMSAGQPSPSSDDYLLYDTGVLTDGVIPDGGTVAIDLSGSNQDAFWLDNMGDDGPCWGPLTLSVLSTTDIPVYSYPGSQLRFDFTINSTGGPNDDDITVSFDIEEDV